MTKQEIYNTVISMKDTNHRLSQKHAAGVSVEKYISMMETDSEENEIWTKAFQTAINENRHVIIPPSDKPYCIDNTITVPSDTYIEALDGAVIRLKKGTKTLLLRNLNNEDGTHKKETFAHPDTNIHISGGIWEEERDGRADYGTAGMYDEQRSYFGVYTCMLFNNVKNLILENMTLSHTGGFAFQIGNVKNIVVENIEFISCFADGVHINGNTENAYIHNIRGEVGDDLVALNMYDWQSSSINFGPAKTIWCEKLNLYKTSRYKAMRLLPGIYRYDDGSLVDCSLSDTVIKNVKGINTFKLYFQSPRYNVEQQREHGNTGSGDNIYFEDIDIDLYQPVDMLKDYMESNPVTGSIAGFELGANIGNLYFENINVKLYKDKYPMSFFICAGPKSVRDGKIEIFDPEINSTVENLYIKNISVNSGDTNDAKSHIHTITFDDIYGDGTATGKGVIKNIISNE